MHFGAISAIDHVTIGDHAILIYEKAAAAREFLSPGVECFNRNGSRFDAPNKIGKFVLRVRVGYTNRDRAKSDESDRHAANITTSCVHYL